MRNGYRLCIRIPHGRQDPNLERFPALIYQELVEWEITRVIAIWVDGHTGIARSEDMLELGGCFVPDQPDPEPEPAVDWPEVDLSAEQFERFWEAALQRVERETGIKPKKWPLVTTGDIQKREQGFYWVRVSAYDGIPSDWGIARWTGDAWYFTWVDRPVAEWEMFEVDERRVVREAL